MGDGVAALMRAFDDAGACVLRLRVQDGGVGDLRLGGNASATLACGGGRTSFEGIGWSIKIYEIFFGRVVVMGPDQTPMRIPKIVIPPKALSLFVALVKSSSLTPFMICMDHLKTNRKIQE